MTETAPKSSTIARATKKVTSAGEIRFPKSITTLTAKAISVAIGMPHPLAPCVPLVIAKKIKESKPFF
jgi:hypothetical protein